MRRLTGNYGVSDLGVAKEKKEKPKRTPPTNLVLGPVILGLLDELCRENGHTRAEMVRTLIAAAHGRMESARVREVQRKKKK